MRLQPFIYRMSILFGFMVMSPCFSVYAAPPVTLTHVHGLNYSADGGKVFIPSHHGLTIYSEGHWYKAKGPEHDYMGFSVTKDAFYSSGHPAQGSPLKNPFGLIKSRDGGETWDHLGLTGESDFHLLATGYETNVVYVVNHAPNSRMDRSGLYYTADDGKKWSFAEKQGVDGNVISIGVHPLDSNVVAVGTKAALYLSKDKGNHFQPIKNGIQILSIFFELDQKHLWYSGFDGRVSLTRLNLETKKTESITIPPMERDAVAYIAQNPVNHKEFTIATFKKDVYQSFDQGKTWKQIAKSGEVIKVVPKKDNVSLRDKKSIEEMVFIKGGCFEMGDTFGEGDIDERPVHEVCLDDFYMGEHEVTQGEWKEIMGNNPSFFNHCGDNCPVEQVSYHDVQEFIRKLNEKTGMTYRLPTEAEWEYAARERGLNVRFGTGKNTVGSDEVNFNASPLYKRDYSKAGVFREMTVPVKSFQPNALGLYDMSGNVFEWTSDWFLMPYYKNSPRNNPKGPPTGLEGPPAGLFKVIRGASYLSPPVEVRVCDRNNRRPEYKHSVLGLRLARTP